MTLVRSRRPRALRRQHPGLRRLLSAGLAALATAVALAHLTPAPPRLVPVLVAAHDIPAGHRLGPDDLALSRWPPGTAPAGRFATAGPAVGRVTSGPVPRDSPVTTAGLLGPGVLSGQPPDLLAVAVPLTDVGLGSVLRRGDRVDVLATAGSTAATSSSSPSSTSPVVTAAVVLADPTAGAGPAAAFPGSGLGAGAGSTGGGLGGASAAYGSTGSVVLGVRLWEAERLARAEASGTLTLAVHPR